MVITIVILLILAGVAIANLGGENGLIGKANQTKKENQSSIEFSYEEKERIEKKVKVLIHIQDTENGIARIEFPDGGIIECFGRTEYAKDNFEVELGQEYIIKITSKSGEIKEGRILVVDKEAIQQNIIIKPSTTEWTNKNIQVEVEWGYNDTNAKKEISIDGGTTYKQYTGTFEVEKNTTIIARITVEGTQIPKELPITNIDKLPPKDFTPTVSDLVSSTELTINANASDTEATEEYGSSGIKEYQYYVYKGTELIDQSEKITSASWNASGLTVGDEYNIYVEVWDNGGEYKKSEEINYTKLEVYKWEKYNVENNGYTYYITKSYFSTVSWSTYVDGICYSKYKFKIVLNSRNQYTWEPNGSYTRDSQGRAHKVPQGYYYIVRGKK